MEFFFENPSVKLTVRELGKKLKLSPSTLHIYLLRLRKEGFLSKDNQWIDNWYNRLIKSNYYAEKFSKSGLIDYLDQELAASCILLFGSFRKGESNQESDIDFFVECGKNKKVDLARFEKKLGHKIQLFTQPNINLLPKHLLNNVVNGIKIKGYFTLK
jgi:predicted nucleotidyltransferase